MSNYINPSPNLNLNLQNNHPIIQREDTYWLNRKLLSVHSEDRDKSKWSNSNEFEFECPQSYTNIQSARLTEINIPSNYYNFSNNMQNTKFAIIANNKTHIIDISNGYYNSTQLATTLKYQLNKYFKPVNGEWNVVYHETKQKFLIGNNYGLEFELDGSVKMDYLVNCCLSNDSSLTCKEENEKSLNLVPPTIDYYERYNKWGFLSYIGFNKKIKYKSKKSKESLELDYLDVKWLTPENNKYIYYIESPNIIDIMGEKVIYMELNYFNSYDELVPYPDSSYNLLISGKPNINYKTQAPGYKTPKYVAIRGAGINSAFAKIPLISNPKSQIFQSSNTFLDNATSFTTPIERITKFKVKFRYHDGRLVDFQENDFNFTLEINQLRNDFDKKLIIKKPQFYSFTS